MAQYQSIDPTLVAINAAKKVTPQVKKPVPASLTTQAPIQPSLNLQTQQPQAISTNITPPTAKIGGISSPFGAPNINSAPMLWWATPQEIGTRATQLQSLPKQIPASWPSMIIPKDTFREKVIQWKQAWFTSTQILQRYKDKWYSIEWLNFDDFLEPTVQQTPLQWQQAPMQSVLQWAKNVVWATLETATGLPRLAWWLVGEWVWAIAKGLWANKENTDKLVESRKQSLKNNQDIWQNRESWLFKGTKLAGDIINTATPMWFSKTATLGEKIGSIPQVANIVNKIPKWLVGKVAKGVAGWLADVSKFAGISDSRLPSPKELAIWATIWWVAPLVWAGISKLATKKPKVVEDVVWQVIQWSKKDIAPAVETLSKIDTKGVKTYEQLWTKVSEANKKLMQAVDWILENDNRLVTPDMFIKTVKAGDEAIKTNYVTKAIDHLDELYTKIDDIESQAMIKSTKSLFEQWKLKLKDINDVLRIYSSEFWDKAFSKATQEPLTSVSAQQYENVRKWAKEMLRSQFVDDWLKLLDEQYSKWAKTLELVNKMSDKVQKLQQKLTDRSFREKAGRLLWRWVDFITWWWLRWLLTSFLPSNIGNKVMNSLDLQERLVSNLDEIEKLVNKVDMWTASKIDLDLIKKYATTLTTIGGASLGKPPSLNK